MAELSANLSILEVGWTGDDFGLIPLLQLEGESVGFQVLQTATPLCSKNLNLKQKRPAQAAIQLLNL